MTHYNKNNFDSYTYLTSSVDDEDDAYFGFVGTDRVYDYDDELVEAEGDDVAPASLPASPTDSNESFVVLMENKNSPDSEDSPAGSGTSTPRYPQEFILPTFVEPIESGFALHRQNSWTNNVDDADTNDRVENPYPVPVLNWTPGEDGSSSGCTTPEMLEFDYVVDEEADAKVPCGKALQRLPPNFARLNTEILDENLAHMNHVWKDGGKYNDWVQADVADTLEMAFRSAANPLVVALYFILGCDDFLSIEVGTLPTVIVYELKRYLRRNEDGVHPQSFLFTKLQQTTFTMLTMQRRMDIVQSVADIYQLQEINSEIEEDIRTMALAGFYVEACTFAVAVGLAEFNVHFFAVPLILQDQETIVYEYLKKNFYAQANVIDFVDQLLSLDPPVLVASLTRYIKNKNILKMRRKEIVFEKFQALSMRLKNLFKTPEYKPKDKSTKIYTAKQKRIDLGLGPRDPLPPPTPGPSPTKTVLTMLMTEEEPEEITELRKKLADSKDRKGLTHKELREVIHKLHVQAKSKSKMCLASPTGTWIQSSPAPVATEILIAISSTSVSTQTPSTTAAAGPSSASGSGPGPSSSSSTMEFF